VFGVSVDTVENEGQVRVFGHTMLTPDERFWLIRVPSEVPADQVNLGSIVREIKRQDSGSHRIVVMYKDANGRREFDGPRDLVAHLQSIGSRCPDDRSGGKVLDLTIPNQVSRPAPATFCDR
jgi:hypothetical protein